MRLSRSWLLFVGVSFAVACGGGKPINEVGKAASELKGRVIKAPVALATVTAFRLDESLQRGDQLAQAKADESGDFALALPPYQGHVLVVATGGSYLEEAIGLGVQLGDVELQLMLPDFKTGTKLEGVRITPVSTLAVPLARFHVSKGVAIGEAHREALKHLHAHFGGVDWSTITPADLTVEGVTNLSPEARAGLLLAGLSWMSKGHAETSDVAPGLVVNAATLTAALARDAADGTFDGAAGTEAVKQAKVQLTGATLRAELVSGMSGFINSPRNASALRLQDVSAFLAEVGTNSDAYLFCPGQMPVSSCGSGPVDTEPPVVAFTSPSEGAGVAGSAVVEVRASDNAKLATLRFTAPLQLTGTTALYSNERREGVLQAVLDVSALPDGPLELRVEATDESGNPTAKVQVITVSNQGPRITFSAPSDATVVSGASVTVAASAQAQAPGATIQKIEFVSPPGGMGADVLPAADSFAATWNTTLALEGRTTLTLRAVDTFGTSTETSVVVTVDNVPFGRVVASVSGGAPVEGVTVKLVAVDPATGGPIAGRMGGPVLGQSTEVTDGGLVAFDLSAENYSGPVQLVAEGSAATYVDPSDGVTTIPLPATFSLSSYFESYSTGDRLEAPVTYWTTLADAAALAYLQGKNPSQPSPVALGAAVRAVDPLFARHITSQPWGIRAAHPVRLTAGPQALRDVVYAAMPDVSLNSLARMLALDVGLTPGTGFGAPQLVDLLRADIADGQFDGFAAGVRLRTGGVTPYELDANTTRLRQALGLDAFIRGAQNTTGLTRQDLQTSSIYDTISGDTSILYPSSQAPIAFDNTPPTINWVVTFTNGSVTGSAPIGASKLVAGVLSVGVTATDASSVASVGVTSSAGMLQSPMTTPSSYEASLNTSGLQDGALTFTATACDRLMNCGSSTYSVQVDRTAPVITVLSPATSLSFVSASFDLEATATDNTQLANLGIDNPAAADQDSQVSRAYAPSTSWTLAAPEGPLNVAFRACDVVGNCQSQMRPVVVDLTPPILTWQTQPTAYTSGSTVSFSVNVTDAAAGVRRVFAGVDYLNPVEGVLMGGVATFAAFPVEAGPKTIRVWAEDLAVPGNTGRLSAVAGADLGAIVIRDGFAPSLEPAAYRTFKDEDAITVATGSNGLPLVPAQYNYGAAPDRTINLAAPSITIRRAVTLTSAATNRPLITWRVPFNAASDAPITGVTWSATRTYCRTDSPTSCPTVSAGGGSVPVDSLVPNPAANSRYYSLELTMPLKGVYAYTFVVTDAAGNTASRTFSVDWDLVGPPLVVVPDIAWEASGDPQAVASARLSNQTFGRIFGVGTTGFLNGQARVKKYYIYNPATVDVAVQFADTIVGSRTTQENWTNLLGNRVPLEGGGCYSVDGHSGFCRDYISTFTGSSDYCADTARLVEPYPCAITAASFPYIRHVRGSATRWECFGNLRSEGGPSYGPGVIHNTNTQLNGATTSNVLTQAVAGPAAPGTGNESLAAPVVFFSPTAPAGAKVPAATGGSPGVVAVYVVVPVEAHSVSLGTAALPHLSGGAYQYYFADMVDISGHSVRPTVTCNGALNYSPGYPLFYWYRRLTSAATVVTANFSIRSGGGLYLGGLTGNQDYSSVTARQVSSASLSNFTINH